MPSKKKPVEKVVRKVIGKKVELVRKPPPAKAKSAEPKKGTPEKAPEKIEAPKDPPLRMTPDGVVLSRVERNREGVIVKILD